MMQATPSQAGTPGKYPDAADIPQVKMDSMQKPQETNPVVSAFETIAKYVQSLEQRNDPKAAPMKEHLTNLMKDVVGSPQNSTEAASNPGEAPMAPGQPPAAEEAPAAASGAPAKIGFNPFNDASQDVPEGEAGPGENPPSAEDQTADAAQPMDNQKMAMMKKKKAMMNKSIQPLA